MWGVNFGPISKKGSILEPVHTANNLKIHLIGNRTNKAHATQTNKIHRAVIPEPAFTRAMLRASKIQPTN